MSVPNRVSVVTIFLNGERFIEEAIDSVFAQTYSDWELLLVDDGSTDSSPAIAKAYQLRHPNRIRYLRHDGGSNLGMSASRNLGIAHATGEFLAFLDADDIWLPQKLQRQVEMLRSHPKAAMAYGPTLCWYTWAGNNRDRGDDYLRNLGVTPNQLIAPPALIPLFLSNRALPPSTCGLLLRMDAAHSAGCFEVSFRGMFEDQAFLYKLCLRETVYVTGECWDRYRMHGDSSTARAEATGSYDGNGPNRAHLDFLHWFEDYLERTGSTDPVIRRALSRAFWHYRYPRLSWLLRRARSFVTKRVRRLQHALKQHAEAQN